jgi:hypothetical protein
MIESKGRGVLDTPPEPVIGLAERRDPVAGMTTVDDATPCVTPSADMDKKDYARSSQIVARWTMVCIAFSMSWTLTHSNRE